MQVTQTIQVSVAKFLVENGYCPADYRGVEDSDYEHQDELGILFDDPVMPKPNILLRFFMKDRRSFIGTINLSQWKLKVFGRHYLPRCMELAHKLEKSFDVEIKVILSSEDTSTENFEIEFGP